MATICYKWNDANISWLTANITWKEACVIDKVVRGAGGTGVKERLTKEEKKILIGLIVKIKENDNIYSAEQTKQKNTKVKVTSKDVRIFIKELKKINIKITL